MTARDRSESSAAWKKLMRKQAGVPSSGMRLRPGMRAWALHCDHSRAMSTSDEAKSAAKVATERTMGTTSRYLKGAVWMGGARSHCEEER